jgi:DnaJ domain
MYTIASLKAEHKTLVAAKTAYKVKAASWQALVNKLNKPSPVKKPSPAKALAVTELKAAIYQRFSVDSTPALRKSKNFAMATDGIGSLNFSIKETWEKLYRQYIGVLPNEVSEEGDNCINGVDIFKYFRPWQVFGLNGKTATAADIKTAYRNLSKIYHPDNQKTGNAAIFDRINIMYQSISARA